MAIDLFTKSEIDENIRRIQQLLDCNIFSHDNHKNPLVRSAFIEILICLRDLMYKSEKYASRIDFDSDVLKSENINDVSDLIKYVRDALCHANADMHYNEKGNVKATYNIAYGKANLVSFGGLQQLSNYEDDICFFFGSQKIYFKRHIIKAFQSAKERLLPLIQ